MIIVKGDENMSKEKQKQEALKRMKALNLTKEVIDDFKKNNRLYYSERQNQFFNAVLYWVDNNEDYVKIVKDFEKKSHNLVYHCQLTHLSFGDCLSLLFVSADEEDWPTENELLKQGIAFAWVENLDDDSCSEMGTIGIKSSMGGIVRTA